MSPTALVTLAHGVGEVSGPTLCVASKIKGGEGHAGDFELFRGCREKSEAEQRSTWYACVCLALGTRLCAHVCSFGSLGCKVGTCCPSLSSLSMCSSVVLPALSRPRNTNLPDFLYSPEHGNDSQSRPPPHHKRLSSRILNAMSVGCCVQTVMV